jgi:hypothetical protein
MGLPEEAAEVCQDPAVVAPAVRQDPLPAEPPLAGPQIAELLLLDLLMEDIPRPQTEARGLQAVLTELQLIGVPTGLLPKIEVLPGQSKKLPTEVALPIKIHGRLADHLRVIQIKEPQKLKTTAVIVPEIISAIILETERIMLIEVIEISI